MELRQLEYFVAVVDEGGFTKAAERLHLAQPGVSAQIRRLERELHTTLLDRSKRTVRLTRAGEAVLPYARTALAAAGRVREAADEVAGVQHGRLAVGMVRSHEVEVAELLGGFHRDHPHVAVTLRELAESDKLAEAVRDAELDVALIALGAGAPPDLAVHEVVTSDLVAAVSHEHPWAGRRTVPLSRLAGEPLVCLARGSGLRSRIEAAFASIGAAPDIAMEASSPAMLAELAAAGLGVALVPSVVVEARDDLHAVAIVQPRMQGRLAFAWRADHGHNPAVAAFADRVRTHFADVGPVRR